MDNYNESSEWVEVFQAFFNAYNSFCSTGERCYCSTAGFKDIEFTFSDAGDFVDIEMYCPDILKGISTCLEKSHPEIKEAVRKMHWLMFEADEPFTYEICEGSYTKEYNQIRRILKDAYTRCFENMREGFLEDVVTEIIYIEFRGRKVEICWRMNYFGDIIADIFCEDKDSGFSAVINDPKYLIDDIHEMLMVPEIIEFCVTDSSWEHELIRNALVVKPTRSDRSVPRHPFCWVYNWYCASEEERCFILHNREIRIQFKPHKDKMYINIICDETGKTHTVVIPAECDRYDEIGEEVVWKIQEFVWEM